MEIGCSGVGFSFVFEEFVKHLFSLLLQLAFFAAQDGLYLVFGLGCGGEVDPLFLYPLGFRGQDFHLVAAL